MKKLLLAALLALTPLAAGAQITTKQGAARRGRRAAMQASP